MALWKRNAISNLNLNNKKEGILLCPLTHLSRLYPCF